MRSIALAALLAGCDAGDLVYDGGPRRGWFDAGPSLVDDRCGSDAPLLVLTDTTNGIALDLGHVEDDEGMACGEHATPGNDVFIALEVRTGDYWHFELSSPSIAARPAMYVTSRGCAACTAYADRCSGAGDEALGVVFDEDGRFYLAIDGTEAGGYPLELDATRPICGDGTPEPGEGCDDGNDVEGDGCDRSCRWEIGDDEVEPNDDGFMANRVLGSRVVNGELGGPGCGSTDSYVFVAPSSPEIDLAFVNADGTPCARADLIPPVELSLIGPGGNLLETGTLDANGCTSLSFAGPVPESPFFVRVRSVPTEAPFQYHLSMTAR